MLSSYQDLWVIGGEAVYRAFLPVAAEIHLTEVDVDAPGDAFAPQLGPEWECASQEPHASSAGLGFVFRVLRRREVASPA